MDRSLERGERTGYAVAVIVNLVLIYATHNVWHLAPFLTGDFERLIWPITASLLVGIVVNLAYLVFAARWFKSVTNLGVLGLSLAVTVRMYQLFPFDFTALEFDWSMTAKALLWVVMVGTAVAMVVEMVRAPLALIEWLDGRSAHPTPRVDQEATTAHMSTIRAE